MEYMNTVCFYIAFVGCKLVVKRCVENKNVMNLVFFLKINLVVS